MVRSETSDNPQSDQPDNDRASSGTRIRCIERGDDGQIFVYLAGSDKPIEDAKIARYFPWSMPDIYFSIRDGNGHEVAMLRSLDELDPTSRQILDEELREKVFNPKILRVLKCTHEFGVFSMMAETDRGRAVLHFRGRDNVRLLSSTRALFRDVDGNISEVADLAQLDAASQRLLRQFF